MRHSQDSSSPPPHRDRRRDGHLDRRGLRGEPRTQLEPAPRVEPDADEGDVQPDLDDRRRHVRPTGEPEQHRGRYRDDPHDQADGRLAGLLPSSASTSAAAASPPRRAPTAPSLTRPRDHRRRRHDLSLSRHLELELVDAQLERPRRPHDRLDRDRRPSLRRRPARKTVTVTADVDAAIKAGALWGWELRATSGTRDRRDRRIRERRPPPNAPR